MAYDGYRQSAGPSDQMGSPPQQPTSPIDPHFAPSTPPYPNQYAPDRLNMPQPQMQPAVSSQPPNQDPAWYQQQHTGRINEAVNSAFYQANPPGYLPPEVVSQITANVIQQLKTTGLDNLQGHQPASPPQSQYQAPPQQAWPSTVPSPRPPYVEPTPAMPAQYPPHPPPQFQPPPQQPWPPVTSSPRPPYAPTMPAQSQGPTPPPEIIPPESSNYQSYAAPTGYPPRPSSNPTSVPQPERRESPFSQGNDYNQNAEARPMAPSRNVTATEMSTLERIWGKFFDNGKPTERLDQFLRGIAVHLIEDYPPGNTLVILPSKMQRFYEDTKVAWDPYPWQDIFDDRTSSISRMLRDLEVEHHLVQEKFHERPDIPGLTPRGFQRWATMMIQAHPEKECERLQNAVLNLPISNPDDKKERFPKEIPERLFSEAPDLSVREMIEESIMRHCHVELPAITDEEIANAVARRAEAAAKSAKNAAESDPVAERGRQPYTTSPSAALDDEEESISPNPIERERKPYSAHPGGGRVYDEAGTSSRRHTGSFSTSANPKEEFLSSPSTKHRPSDAHNEEPPYSRTASRRFTKSGRSRSSSRVNPSRHPEGDLIDRDNSHRYPRPRPTGEYYFDPARSNLPGDYADDSRRHRDPDLEAEAIRLQDSHRERERERQKSKYHDHFPHRSSWADDEDYYRGAR